MARSDPETRAKPVPSYLEDYRELYLDDPRTAALQWFRDANYGLFLHYGLYSLLGRHEWVQFREQIPVAEYEKLADRFTAEKFDAMAIAEFAKQAGMRYINITTRHHDGFCLFNSKHTDFNSAKSPANRDLIAELSVACECHGLGLCLYYSHGRDWRHPHAPNNDEWGGSARPAYDSPEPSYAYGADHDLDTYLAFMEAQIRELLDAYGPVAAIWLDGIAVPLSRDPNPFRCQELYDMIHDLQEQVLVSYKQGLLGTEDFFAPEHNAVPNPDAKPMEVCTTMAPGSWGYTADKAGAHRSADDVWQTLQTARREHCNLLLNSGPLPDGSLETEDVDVILEIGQRLEREGFPE